jgi:hypothetical protein
MDEIVPPSYPTIRPQYQAPWVPLLLALAAVCGCVALPKGLGGASAGPNCGDACEGCPPEQCETCSNCGSSSCNGCNGIVGTLFGYGYTVCYVPSLCVGSVANFCGPPSCVGPPDIPPPGRFHPVPTRPAFAPRNETPFGAPDSPLGNF